QIRLFERSILLVVESMRIVPSIEAYQTLHQLLKFLPHRPIANLEHNSSVYHSLFDLSSQYLTTIGDDGIATVWNVSSGHRVTKLKYKVANGVYCSNKCYLVTAARRRGGVFIWEISSGRQIAHLQHECAVIAVAISSDGHYVAT